MGVRLSSAVACFFEIAPDMLKGIETSPKAHAVGSGPRCGWSSTLVSLRTLDFLADITERLSTRYLFFAHRTWQWCFLLHFCLLDLLMKSTSHYTVETFILIVHGTKSWPLNCFWIAEQDAVGWAALLRWFSSAFITLPVQRWDDEMNPNEFTDLVPTSLFHDYKAMAVINQRWSLVHWLQQVE